MRLGIDVQLKELKALLPAVKRLGVLYDPANSANDVKEADKVAGALGMQLVTATMADVRELGGALKNLLEQKIDALWLLADPTVTPPGNSEAFEYVAANTLQAGVPVVGYAEKLTQGGALLSIGPDYGDIGKQAGEMVKAILTGSSPDQVGIQNARKAALTINKKVAATLGVELPADAQARAVQVFQ
jgi:putative ABC transport system substrate-binding protein